MQMRTLDVTSRKIVIVAYSWLLGLAIQMEASVLPAQSSIPSAAPSSAPPWQTSPAIQTAPAAASGLHAAAHSTSAPSHWYSGSSCSGTCVLPGGSSPACCKWQQIWGLMTSTLKHRAPCCSRRRPHAKLVV
eukprot:scaffold41968_cov20-Tisochrysis_lutea.AAC.3